VPGVGLFSTETCNFAANFLALVLQFNMPTAVAVPDT
jgi:hypothetical protein